MTHGGAKARKPYIVRPRRGRPEYVYAWRGGPRINAPRNSPEFYAEMAAAYAAQKARPATDTIAGLVLEYRASRAFAALAPATRHDHERAFVHILAEFGPAPVAAFGDPRIRRDIRRFHDGFAHDRQADKILGSLSRLLTFAVADGLIAVNPCAQIDPRYRRAPDPRPVPEAAIEATLASAATPPEIAIAIRFMWRTGFSLADAAGATRAHVRPDRIEKRRCKSKILARAPMTAELRAVIEDAATFARGRRAAMTAAAADGRNEPNQNAPTLTILCDARGAPWRADTLGKKVSAAFAAAGPESGAQGHTSHDLRASYACLLMRRGGADEEIADSMGWSRATVRHIRRYYVDDAAIFAGRIAKFSDEA